MEIMDGVHQITLGCDDPSGSRPTVSAYYVLGTDHGVFIDAGFPGEERIRPLLDYWRDTLSSPQESGSSYRTATTSMAAALSWLKKLPAPKRLLEQAMLSL